MTTSNTLKNLIKLFAGYGLATLSFSLVSADSAKANCLDDFGLNPSSMNDSCEITPARYSIKVYEMGFCTSDPLSGTNYDGSSCTTTFSNSSGSEVDIASSTSTLIGTNTRPPVGTYSYAYIKMSNTFGLRGTYLLNGTTNCSKSDGTGETTSGCTGTNFSETLVDFAQGGTCSGSPEYSASVTYSTGVTGTMKARLTDSSYVTSTSCGGSTHLVGMFAPTSPVVVSDATKGLEVDFTVTDSGMTVIPDNSSGETISSFGSGPFRPRFTAY